MKKLFYLLFLGLLSGQPVNDNCSNALQLNIGGCLNNQTTNGATAQVGEPVACYSSVGRSVWYWFQAGANDNALRLIIDVTNNPGCTGTLAVYGPYTNAPNCMPANSHTIHCDLNFMGTSMGTLNTAHYVDISVQPGQYYMVQVRGFTGGFCGSTAPSFNICLQRACNHCGNLCLTNVCNYPSNTAPSVTWVTSNCSATPPTAYDPIIDQYSWLNICFSFTAISSQMYHTMVISGYCSQGNVYSATWSLYDNTCAPLSGPNNLLSNNLATGLVVGATYRICYRINSSCPHLLYYPFTYAAPLPAIILNYYTNCNNAGEIEIVWNTAVEENIMTFYLDKSFDMYRWDRVAEVAPKGGHGIKEYIVRDKTYGQKTYYRLSEHTKTGNIIEIGRTIAEKCGSPVIEIQNLNGTTVIQFTAVATGIHELYLYDITGKQYLKYQVSLASGNTQHIPINLAEGVYLIYLRMPNGNVYTRHFYTN